MSSGLSRDTRCSVLSALCSSSVWAEVDTWPLIQGGCYHVTEVGGLRRAENCRVKSRGLCEIIRGTMKVLRHS